MAKVRLIAQISGTRNGDDWPKPGTVIDVPDEEAASLVENGFAADPKSVETADVPSSDVETASAPPATPAPAPAPERATKRPAKKAAAAKPAQA